MITLGILVTSLDTQVPLIYFLGIFSSLPFIPLAPLPLYEVVAYIKKSHSIHHIPIFYVIGLLSVNVYFIFEF